MVMQEEPAVWALQDLGVRIRDTAKVSINPNGHEIDYTHTLISAGLAGIIKSRLTEKNQKKSIEKVACLLSRLKNESTQFRWNKDMRLKFLANGRTHKTSFCAIGPSGHLWKIGTGLAPHDLRSRSQILLKSGSQ
jgi:hypothetical protein